MKTWWLAVVVLLAASDCVRAAEYVQRYIRPSDKKVLLEIKGGQVTTTSKEKGDKLKTKDGVEYVEVVYRVYVVENGKEKKVNEQLVWCFTQDAQGDDTRSNRWIYWCKPLEGGKGRIWGRCPTPKHPDYKGWKEKHGSDLWQVVPPAKRKDVRDDADPDKAVKLMAMIDGLPKIIGENDDDMPRVVPPDRDRDADRITCVQFENFI